MSKEIEAAKRGVIKMARRVADWQGQDTGAYDNADYGDFNDDMIGLRASLLVLDQEIKKGPKGEEK